VSFVPRPGNGFLCEPDAAADYMLMSSRVAYEAQVRYGPDEPWLVVGVRFDPLLTAGIAYAYRGADPLGRVPMQWRVMPRSR
jgi:hypothetical protein